MAHTGERRDAHRMFMGKTEGNRPGCRWENDIKMDLKEIESVGVDCSVLVMELTTEYNTHQKVGW